MIARQVDERLWEKIDRSDDGCWPWTAALDTYGYGRLMVGSRVDGSRHLAIAHRLAYEFTVGPIPKGTEIDHLCRNKKCCNPAHLEAVPHSVNVNRAVAGSDALCVNGHEKVYHVTDKRYYCRTCRRDAGRRHDAKRRNRIG